ncbi:YgiT-type zinc finger protein [Paenibacillus thermotolerans]|uniref:YgiT-type zinc finger protein n=1 Tax=Paenibacillus thermotolerans TaxID=3027807 RepID=UPI0023680A97|nr:MULTISPECIES: YgiT-type zinc finger protein [unclassified Paenibacillus]
MEKQCVCGATMEIRLRTVIFSGKVTIENVPVLSCSGCERSIVHPDAKPELSDLLRSLGDASEKKQIFFHEVNEFAFLLREATRKDRSHVPLEHIISERVNELLDLLLLAQSVHDTEWANNIRERLSQITKKRIATY